MKLKNLTLILKNAHNLTTQIDYEVFPTDSAQIWAQCILKAHSHGLYETKRFYGLFENPTDEIEYLLNRLNEKVLELKKLHPEVDFPSLDRADLQNSINNLHFNFAHSHHVTHLIESKNIDIWNDFNTLLHAIESALTSQQSLQNTGLPLARIVATWNKPHYTEIPDQCYQDFSIKYDFGLAYINYAEVGRHLFEMFYSEDDTLADEHIRPSRIFSANTHFYFGPTLGHRFTQQKMTEMQTWFETRKARFHKLGLFWPDPKLALGQVAVARMKQPLYTQHDIQQFVFHLAKFNQVSELIVN